MELLTKTGLYGQGLLPVTSAVLVARYNACLSDIGLEPTRLTSFSIDGLGWSPEIAEEKKSSSYLVHSDANPYAIIISLDQINKPHYLPRYSFDKSLIRLYCERFTEQIAFITSRTGIWLSMDNDLSEYRSPLDILTSWKISMSSHTPSNLLLQAQNQASLVKQFNKESNWRNTELHNELRKSGREIGDVRHQPTNIPILHFKIPNSFYIWAFSGIFFINTQKKNNLENIVVVNANKWSSDWGTKPSNVYLINELELWNSLDRSGFLVINGMSGLLNQLSQKKGLTCKSIVVEPSTKETLRTFLIDLKFKVFLTALCQNFPEAEYYRYTPGKHLLWTKRLQEKNQLPPLFYEIEKTLRSIEVNNVVSEISLELYRELAMPASHLDLDAQKILNHLLARQTRYNFTQLYHFDKNAFFAQYQTWPDLKKYWTTKLLLEEKQEGSDQKNARDQEEIYPHND